MFLYTLKSIIFVIRFSLKSRIVLTLILNKNIHLNKNHTIYLTLVYCLLTI